MKNTLSKILLIGTLTLNSCVERNSESNYENTVNKIETFESLDELQSHVQNFEAYDVAQTAIGDIDGDGDLDVIYTSDYGVSVYENNISQGSLSNNTSTSVFTSLEELQSILNYIEPYDTGHVSLGDLDGDGDLDAIYTTDLGHDILENRINQYIN